MTPGAEFNTYADSIASARVFALTSQNPHLTMPPVISNCKKEQLTPYPENLSKRLTIKLFPLDTTESHVLPKAMYEDYINLKPIKGSPMAEWTSLFLDATFKKNASLNPQQDATKAGLQLHDPLTIWVSSFLNLSSTHVTRLADHLFLNSTRSVLIIARGSSRRKMSGLRRVGSGRGDVRLLIGGVDQLQKDKAI